MNLRTIIAISFLGVVTIGMTGCHGPGDLSDPKNREKVSRFAHNHLENRLEDLDATEAQLKALEGVEKPVLDQAFQAYDGNKPAKEALIAEWNSAAPDATKVHTIIDERVDALRKVLHVAGDAAIKIHATLTPEQRKEAAEQMDCH